MFMFTQILDENGNIITKICQSTEQWHTEKVTSKITIIFQTNDRATGRGFFGHYVTLESREGAATFTPTQPDQGIAFLNFRVYL